MGTKDYAAILLAFAITAFVILLSLGVSWYVAIWLGSLMVLAPVLLSAVGTWVIGLSIDKQ